jgi:hypothetical protein
MEGGWRVSNPWKNHTPIFQGLEMGMWGKQWFDSRLLPAILPGFWGGIGR